MPVPCPCKQQNDVREIKRERERERERELEFKNLQKKTNLKQREGDKTHPSPRSRLTRRLRFPLSVKPPVAGEVNDDDGVSAGVPIVIDVVNVFDDVLDDVDALLCAVASADDDAE